MPPQLTLHVVWDEGLAPAPDVPAEWLQRVAQAALDSAAPTLAAGRAEVALLLAGDATLQRLNRDYRGDDKPTDVLSFAQLEGDRLATLDRRETVHLGDIAISVERAREQAGVYGHAFQRELAYLLTHGVLHLLGHDHEDDAERAAMREHEEASLAALGITRDAPPLDHGATAHHAAPARAATAAKPR